MFENLFKSINAFWISFYNWWYGILPVRDSERREYINTLVTKNKRQELEHRIQHNFTNGDIDVLVDCAIQHKNSSILKFIRNHLKDYQPNLSFEGGNLLHDAYDLSEKCFIELISMLLSSTTAISYDDNQCIKGVLEVVITEIRESANQFRHQKLSQYKHFLVTLLPNQYSLLDEDLSLYQLIEKMHLISEQKRLLETTYDINIPFNEERTLLMNRLLFKLVAGELGTNERKELSYLNETINFEKALYDDEGNSLLTRLLGKDTLTAEYVQMIASMNSEVTFDYIEDDMYSFKDIYQMYQTLISLVEQKSPIVDKMSQYIHEAFKFVCQSHNIKLDNRLTIDKNIALFNRLFGEDKTFAKNILMYDFAANLNQPKHQRQLLIKMFDGNQLSSDMFQQMVTLLPTKLLLEDQDIKMLLKNQNFALNVLDCVLNHFDLNVAQMSLIFKFMKEHADMHETIRMKDIYVWNEKFVNNPEKYLHNEITDLFDVSDWGLIFSTHLEKYETVKALYSHYIFGIKDNAAYNPYVREGLTLLADAINHKSFDFAKNILSFLHDNLCIHSNEDLLNHLTGVNFESVYLFLEEISYEDTNKLMFDLAKYYLDNNRAIFVKVGLESLSDVSKELLDNIYVYIIENNLDLKEILNLIRPKSYNPSLDSDLKLMLRLFKISYTSEIDKIEELFSRILMSNPDIERWSEENIQFLANMLVKNMNAKAVMRTFIIRNRHNQSMYPLFARCIPSMLSPNDNKLFLKVSTDVLDAYLANGDTVSLEHWFRGITDVSGDVLQNLLEELDVIRSLLTGFDVYEMKSYDSHINRFLTIASEKNIELNKLTRDIGLNDLILIEKLVQSSSVLKRYFKDNKLSMYSQLLIKLVNEAFFDSDGFDQVIQVIKNDLDKHSTHRIIDSIIHAKSMTSDVLDKNKLMFILNQLPVQYVSTYVISKDKLTDFSELGLSDKMMIQVASYSNACHTITAQGLLSDYNAIQLNDHQLVDVWSKLIEQMKLNKTNSVENVLWFMSQYGFKNVLTTHFTSLIEGLPQYKKPVFNKFIDQLSQLPSFDNFMKVYWKEIRKWEMNTKNSLLGNKYDVSPLIRSLINKIDEVFVKDVIVRENLDILFDLINRLSLFPLHLRRKLALQHKLFDKIIQLEIRLRPEANRGATLLEQMVKSHYDLIGSNFKAFINMMNYEVETDYRAMIKQSEVSVDDLLDFLMLERNRELFSYDFDTSNIKGKMPSHLFLIDHYKRAFFAIISHVLDENGDADGSVADALEWLEYDQLIRNIAKYDAKKIDFKKLAYVMDSAPDLLKDEAIRIKQIVIEQEISQIEDIMSKISEELMKNPLTDKVESLTSDMFVLESALDQLNVLLKERVNDVFPSESMPKASVIISLCGDLANAADMIDVIVSSPEGRKLIKDDREAAMKPYYSHFFKVTLQKYLALHQHCQQILDKGHSIDEGLISSLEKHLLKMNVIEGSNMPSVCIESPIKELDNLLYTMQFIMTWYHVSAYEMTAAEKNILLRVLETNGSYAFERLLDESRNMNLNYADNFFQDNKDGLEALPVKRIISSGKRNSSGIQGMFSAPEQKKDEGTLQNNLNTSFRRLSAYVTNGLKR